MLWNQDSMDLQVVSVHNHFIHVTVSLNSDIIHLLAVYAPLNVHDQRDFWRDLEKEVKYISLPCFIEGDFNCILSLEDRLGGAGTFPLLGSPLLGFSGSRFTWSYGKEMANRVSKHLDRVFTNLSSKIRWEEGHVMHLPAVRSDHKPLLLCLEKDATLNQDRKPFKFEAAWLLHPNFLETVDRNWNLMLILFMP
ncbi:hypothetical protein V2J09_004902 [Rumex salicifolius]